MYHHHRVQVPGHDQAGDTQPPECLTAMVCSCPAPNCISIRTSFRLQPPSFSGVKAGNEPSLQDYTLTIHFAFSLLHHLSCNQIQSQNGSSFLASQWPTPCCCCFQNQTDEQQVSRCMLVPVPGASEPSVSASPHQDPWSHPFSSYHRRRSRLRSLSDLLIQTVK